MKYFAILKDSLLEALDSKVLYVTLALSALVIVGVASISFVPRPAQEGVDVIVKKMPDEVIPPGFGRPPVRLMNWSTKDFQQTNDAARPAEASYRFTVVAEEVEPLAFRLQAWMAAMQRDDAKLSQSDRETRDRLRKLDMTMRLVPPDKAQEVLGQKLAEEVGKVDHGQMEQYVKESLLRLGGLRIKGFRFLDERPTDKPAKTSVYEFEVETAPNPDALNTWPHKVALFFGALPMTDETPIGVLVYIIEDVIVGGLGAGIALLASTVVTAFFIPNMLQKGTIDLLVSKPVHRVLLLVYKYIGGLTFMAINATVAIVGVWLVIGLRTGIWGWGLLVCVLVLTFQFALFYALSTLCAVLTRSAVVSIVAVCLFWALLWATGAAYNVVQGFKGRDATNSGWDTADRVINTARVVLPRYKDLDTLTSSLVISDTLVADNEQRKEITKLQERINWWESFGVTTGYIAFFLALASWRFARKDF